MSRLAVFLPFFSPFGIGGGDVFLFFSEKGRWALHLKRIFLKFDIFSHVLYT